MSKSRLEAFSDGVLAVIITIMVLELKVPEGGDLSALHAHLPIMMSYVLSFIYIGIYWTNHHHLFHATRKITGGIMWANLHLLFWLSLVPVATGWVGAHPREPWPTALYGGLLFMASVAWLAMERLIIARNGRDSELALAVGHDVKGLVSTLLYAVAIGLAFVEPLVSDGLYALVALVWIVPDPRIERRVSGG
jgi:uncharacterized membrane protein